MTNDTAPDYGTGARLFHWLTAALILVQMTAGIAMTIEAVPSLNDAVFILHKGLGCIFLLVVLARLGWKLTHRVPALPARLPALQRRIAARTHWLLYGLLVVLPVSGYIRTVGDGYPIEMLDALGIPPLVTGIPGTAHVMRIVHTFGGYLLAALIAVHVGAAVHQQLFERDNVLSRMWPPVRPRGRGTRA